MCGACLAVELEREEAIELAVAVLGLAIVYAYPALWLFPLALLAVASAFIPHELAHRFTAEHLGLRARFRLSVSSLVSSLLLCLVTGGVMKVGAAGAVEVEGFATADDAGQIAIAGPLANIAVACLASLLAPASLIFGTIALVNAGLAIFNLLPLPPLDGLHVFRWNRGAWSLVFGLALLTATIASVAVARSVLGWLLWFAR